MKVPFQRVAILEPTLTFGSEFPSSDPDWLESKTKSWLAQAIAKGADAIYPRLHDTHLQAMLVAACLVESQQLKVLLPAWLWQGFRQDVGLHFTSAAPFLPPKKRNYSPIGKSCHSMEEALLAEAAGADYIFLSPIFPTQTHPDEVPLGSEALAQVCAAVSIPVFALGGLNAEREAECLAAGAAGIAGIRMFFA